MKKSKRFSGIDTMLIIIILLANLYLTSANLTKAKYVSELYGNGSASTSNWNVSLKYNNATKSSNYSIPLQITAVPGSTESFDFVIDATACTTEMPMKYDIKIEPISTSIPSNINFYIGSESNTILNTTYTGTMTTGNTSNVTVNFKWNLSNTNEDAFQDVTLQFKLTVKAYSST